ncbi:MAG: TIGR00296 family protein [Candidatus Pacearchaeota archaeon]|nr:TIGR00296 family protein [Candidatus Pacearchaeota archaeon]
MPTLSQGRKLVKLARKAIWSFFKKEKLDFSEEKEEFSESKGVFVTLYTYPKKELRGCIGFPYPILPLAEAVVQAARAAAFSDPRFFPLKEEELEKIVIEISILTKPEQIKSTGTRIPEDIKIGKDGLIIEFLGHSGLLLPQVAVELKLKALDFLRAVCNKAGLPSEAWLDPRAKIYKFQAQVFSETRPKGKVIEKKVHRKT